MSENKKTKRKKLINFALLNKTVIKPGYCTVCGGCEGVCPVNAISIINGKPKLVSACISCGACVDVCLRFNQRKDIEKERPVMEDVIRLACVGRSSNKEIAQQAQNGGIISTILKVAFQEKIIDSAIVTVAGKDYLSPEPLLALSGGDIFKAAGSKYAINPVLKQIYAIKYSNRNNVAVVGLPCHIETLSHIVEKGYFGADKKVKLKLGLLCMNTYEPEMLKEIIKKETEIEIENIAKMDITGGKLHIYTKNGEKKSIPLKTAKEAKAKGCYYCKDLVPIAADITAGNIGVNDDSNIIIISTEKGEKIINLLKEKGMIEIDGNKCKEWVDNLEMVSKLAKRKIKNAKALEPLEEK